MKFFINPLSANFTKWSNRLKQFVGKLQTNCFGVFGHFVGLALKGLRIFRKCDQFRRKMRICSDFTEEILNGKLRKLCTVLCT